MQTKLSPYSTEVQRELFWYKVKRAYFEHRRGEERKRKFQEEHVCENSPFLVHDYQPYKPFNGCFKLVCRFCLKENPDKILQPSVYSFKGRRFEFKAKNRSETVRTYTAT